MMKGSTQSWFSEDVKKGLIDAVNMIPTSHFPVNSLDVDGSTLISGSDNECIYVMNNVLYD